MADSLNQVLSYMGLFLWIVASFSGRVDYVTLGAVMHFGGEFLEALEKTR